MELIFNYALDRKKLTREEFIARLRVPVLVYKPGKKDESRMRTSTEVGAMVKNIDFESVKKLVRAEANQYRCVRLQTEGKAASRDYIIGRTSLCHVVLNLTSVSKQHATLTVQSDGKVFVRDLGSKNGTKVNGKAVGETPVLVKSPQVISLGGNELSVLDPGAFYDLLTEFLVAT
jgi:hypothetical protein